MEGFAGLSTIWLFFLFIMAVLWFFIPFAVFGIKPLLKEILKEIRLMNKNQHEAGIYIPPSTKPNIGR